MIEQILSHKDTRTIPCRTVRHALDGKPIHFKTEDNSFEEDMIKQAIEQLNALVSGKPLKPKPEESLIQIEINPRLYVPAFENKFGASFFEHILDTTFISPLNTNRITTALNSQWKKDPTSGRSFYFVSENHFISIINKGGDLLKGTKFRRYPIQHIAPPMIGSATLEELTTEYQSALAVQEQSLRLQGRTTWAPQPIKLDELTHFILESQDIVSFKEYINKVIGNQEVAINIFSALMSKIDLMDVPEEYEATPFVWAAEKYLEIIGAHGTYLYAIDGLNTRLIDVEKLGELPALKHIISRNYPSCNTPEEICSEFMKRLGEYYGITQGAGMTYLNNSNCLLVDTTIGGVTMDIGDLTIKLNQEAYVNSFINCKATSFYFYNMFFPDSKEENPQFLKLFEQSFVKTLLKYACQSNELVENRNLRDKARDMMNSIESQLDQLIGMKRSTSLRTRFLDFY